MPYANEGGELIDIVILAGGKCEAELAAATGVEYRAEVPFQGKTMAQIVLEAVQPLGETIIVGGPTGLDSRQIEGGQSFVQSLTRGVEAVTTERFLLTTVDLPCLTTAAAQDFIERSDPEAALNYPIIPLADCDKQFPGMKRTTLRLREGVFTGGNLGYMRKDLMTRALPVIQQAYEARKSPLKLASLIGFGTLGRVILGKLVPSALYLPDLEQRVGKFLGVKVRAVVTPFAEIGADIDNLAQYNSLINLRKS